MEVVAAVEELRADPLKATSVDGLRARLADRHAKGADSDS